MRRGLLITRGTIIEPGGDRDPRWSLVISRDTSIAEVAGLMQAFGCYAELAEGETDVRLLPVDYRPPPTGDRLAAFYQAGNFPTPSFAKLVNA